MLEFLNQFHSFIEPNVYLNREEVIRRYRSLNQFDQTKLQILLMLQFSFLYRSDSNEIYLS
jgi:hypothetical protein